MTPVNANDGNTMKDDAGFVGCYEFQPVERFTPPRLTVGCLGVFGQRINGFSTLP